MQLPSAPRPKRTIRIELPSLHLAQRQVLADAKRFNLLSCGRRFGKTVLGADRIIKPALEGFPTAWFSPSSKMLLETWRGLQGTLEPIIVDKSEAEHRIALRGADR